MFADCWHPVINGVVTSMEILRTRLQSLGHEVELFVPNQPGLPDHDPHVHRFFSVSLPIHRESRFSLPYPWSHIRRLKQSRPDVLHIHTPFNLGQLGRWVSEKLRIPYVFTHHTLWEEYVHYVPLVSRRLLRRAAVSICRRMCSRAAVVITPSHEVCARLQAQGVVRPIEVIPTGIDMEVFQGGDPARVRQELGISAKDAVAIYAGRMGKEKSIDFVLDAFASLVKDVPNARLLMVGGGPGRAALEEQAHRLGLLDTRRVLFTGYLPRRELVHYFKTARVLLFASTTETQGLVSLEAQAAGCPVVAVRAPGSSEAVLHDETGFLVPADLDAFASAARRLLVEDDLHTRMADRAVQRAASASSLEMASHTLAAYARAVAEVPAPRRAWSRLWRLRGVRR